MRLDQKEALIFVVHRTILFAVSSSRMFAFVGIISDFEVRKLVKFYFERRPTKGAKPQTSCVHELIDPDLLRQYFLPWGLVRALNQWIHLWACKTEWLEDVSYVHVLWHSMHTGSTAVSRTNSIYAGDFKNTRVWALRRDNKHKSMEGFPSCPDWARWQEKVISCFWMSKYCGIYAPSLSRQLSQ